ncbi:GumC family protein [Parasphingorhabdus sp. DH2-15]|uniref:GumC family protein n=1 Tax=Parasphingorhabdus sp. DH2-15 TaxID=3444112 RepID=UPI003F68667D
MSHTPSLDVAQEEPGLPQKLWQAWRNRRPFLRRHRRYFITAGSWVAVIWILTALYLAISPPQYRSKFTLILPGSGAGSSLNVESIGQAQSNASSAFSSASLSPTENYKRLLMTDITLDESAKMVDEDAGKFPAPRVTLTDQTNLIKVEIGGSTAEQAQERANALRNSFLKQLDALRNDEAEQREAGESENLKKLEQKVRDTQQALLDFQARTGLVSLDQFNGRIANLDAMRNREREARIALKQKSSETGSLSSILGKNPSSANTSLRLASDPQFGEIAQRYAKVDAQYQEMSATLGPNHANLAKISAERQELRTALAARGRALTGLGANAILQRTDIMVGQGRSNLMQSLVVSAAQKEAAASGLAEIRRDITAQSLETQKLVEQASELADLTRDHRVAEAVFSSALARIDTNKQDPFASYPLVQVLEQPSLPKSTSSPSLLIALAGALGATFFMLAGLMLLWFRTPIINKIKPLI